MKIVKNTFSSIVALSLFAAGSAQSAEMASGEEIRALVSGMTVHGSMLAEGYELFTEFYMEDGTTKGDGYVAKWWIENDTMCGEYNGEATGCWAASIEGPVAIWWRDGKIEGSTVSRPGNVNGF